MYNNLVYGDYSHKNLYKRYTSITKAPNACIRDLEATLAFDVLVQHVGAGIFK